MDIPYFLQILKQNVILYSIVTSGSFTQLDLSEVNHNIYTPKGIEFFNFALNDEHSFENVKVIITESETIVLFTCDAKYFEQSQEYFGQGNEVTRNGLFNSKVNSKRFSYLNLEEPVRIAVRKSSFYGYLIAVTFLQEP